MADKTHKKRIINLLPDKGGGLLNQFFTWSLTVGRLLVIITETLALSVFLYRFSIDMRLVDLHDKIEATSIIVKNFGDSEDKFRSIHTRLTEIKNFNNQNNRSLNIIKDVIDMARGKMTFKSLTVTLDEIILEVQAQSTVTLSTFMNQLKSYPEITNISVDRVENKTSDALITVGITATLKPQGGNK